MHHLNSPSTAIVIGGGIAGCATAHALAQKNIAVTLIERHQHLALEASGNPFAVLYPRLTGQPTALEALNLQGYLHTLGLMNSLGIIESQYRALGVVQLAMTPQLAKQQSHAANQYQNSQVHIKACNAQELSQITGVDIAHNGLFFKDAGGIHLAHLCQLMMTDARIQSVTNTSALRLIKTQSTWQVIDSKQNCIAKANSVVIANSMDALQFKETAHLPLMSARGQLSYLPATFQSQINTIICGDGYITPSIDGVHYLGASFHADDAEAQCRERDHEHNLQLLKAMCPSLYHTHANVKMQGRVAWRCQSKDYLPLAGPLLDAQLLESQKIYHNHPIQDLPWLDGLFVNIGHGAKGFLTAPMCGQMIANVIAKAPQAVDHQLINAMQPNRFILRALGLKAISQHLIT